MAIRSVWSGSISFGLVNIPVKLYGAVEEKAIRFNTLHRECGGRISMPKFCTACDRKLETEEMVKGYPVGDDRFVRLEDEDFKTLPVKTLKAIEVVEFVDARGFDPRVWDKPYFVAPDKAGVKAFALLLHGMEQVGKVAVGRLTMREREHLCAIRPYEDQVAHHPLLLLQTLLYTDELRDAEDYWPNLPEASPQELDLAMQLIQALESPELDLSKYSDEYREALELLIEARLNGKVLEATPVLDAKPTDDILGGLAASIAAAKARKAA